MQYRDLIPSRLGGRFIASHIVIPDGGPVPDYVHHHAVRFQLIFCNAGWVKVVYEDQGEPFVMHPGDCVIQPPHIRHQVLASSDELEVVEIGCPADHDTHRDHDLELPNGVGPVDRAWDGQRFVRHVDGDGDWESWRQDGWIAQPFGIATATGGLAEGRLVRTQAAEAREPGELHTHDDEFDLLFVRSGELRFRCNPVSASWARVIRSWFRLAMRIGWWPNPSNSSRSSFRLRRTRAAGVGNAQVSTR